MNVLQKWIVWTLTSIVLVGGTLSGATTNLSSIIAADDVAPSYEVACSSGSSCGNCC